MNKELKKLSIQNRIARLSTRAKDNRPIIKKLERRYKALDA